MLLAGSGGTVGPTCEGVVGAIAPSRADPARRTDDHEDEWRDPVARGVRHSDRGGDGVRDQRCQLGVDTPDGTGQIHGCYKAGGASSALSVINTALHKSCPSGDTALRWDASPPGIGVGTGTATAGTTAGAQCTIGEIGLLAQHGAYLPTSYLVANGQALKIASWSPLFAVIGTTYGGDGKTTFDLPSLEKLAPDRMTYAICGLGVFP